MKVRRITAHIYTPKALERFYVLQILGRDEGLFQVALDKRLQHPGQDCLWPVDHEN